MDAHVRVLHLKYYFVFKLLGCSRTWKILPLFSVPADRTTSWCCRTTSIWIISTGITDCRLLSEMCEGPYLLNYQVQVGMARVHSTQTIILDHIHCNFFISATIRSWIMLTWHVYWVCSAQILFVNVPPHHSYHDIITILRKINSIFYFTKPSAMCSS